MERRSSLTVQTELEKLQAKAKEAKAARAALLCGKAKLGRRQNTTPEFGADDRLRRRELEVDGKMRAQQKALEDAKRWEEEEQFLLIMAGVHEANEKNEGEAIQVPGAVGSREVGEASVCKEHMRQARESRLKAEATAKEGSRRTERFKLQRNSHCSESVAEEARLAMTERKVAEREKKLEQDPEYVAMRTLQEARRVEIEVFGVNSSDDDDNYPVHALGSGGARLASRKPGE